MPGNKCVVVWGRGWQEGRSHKGAQGNFGGDGYGQYIGCHIGLMSEPIKLYTLNTVCQLYLNKVVKIK